MLANPAGVAVVPVLETGSGVGLTVKTSLVLTLEPVVFRVELNVEGAVSTIGSRSGLCASFGTDVGAVPFAGKVDVIIADVQIHMKY